MEGLPLLLTSLALNVVIFEIFLAVKTGLTVILLTTEYLL